VGVLEKMVLAGTEMLAADDESSAVDELEDTEEGAVVEDTVVFAKIQNALVENDGLAGGCEFIEVLIAAE